MDTFKILLIIVILSILGFLLSSYLIYNHYMYISSPEYKSGCAWFTETKEDPCRNVDTTEYSKIFNIPVALFGGCMYIFILFLSILSLFKKMNVISKILFITTLLGVLFHIYLTYIEVFVIKVICPLCVLAFLTTSLIFLSSIFLIRSVNPVPLKMGGVKEEV